MPEWIGFICEKLLELITSAMDDVPLLPLLTKCILCLQTVPSAFVVPKDFKSKSKSQYSDGTDFANRALKQLFDCDWSAKTVASFCAIFKDFNMTEEQLKTVCKKSFTYVMLLDNIVDALKNWSWQMFHHLYINC